jgi:hypothetical protein
VRPPGPRIGFLFNHSATHQVGHAAPFAFELSRRSANALVTIACTSEAQCAAAEKIGERYPGHRVAIVGLTVPWPRRAALAVAARFWFVGKRWMLASNLDFFRGFDAIVAPEKTFLQLRTRFGLSDLRLIHTRHGAGDREGSFDRRTREFDLTLVQGQKYLDRFAEHGHLREGHCAIVGYAKFEAYGNAEKPPALFHNSRPTVLYNPHFDKRVSSWQRQGRAVLEWFAAQREYNLIFSPHVMLFKHAWRRGMRVPRSIRSAPNIHIDLGTEASIDMTYTRAADIYLGDVSSQVYEFIAQPRPCVFLNAHRVAWQDSAYFSHWHFGPVIERADQLGSALASAQRDLACYEATQREAFAYTFSVDPERTAAERGADAILEFMAEGKIASGRYLGIAAGAGRCAPLRTSERRLALCSSRWSCVSGAPRPQLRPPLRAHPACSGG